MASGFRNVIDFFAEVGLYDVVLPFLLVFTIVFAIFEKTRILGTEEIDGKQYARKNLNAMAAFVIAFFTIASAELVEIISEVSSNVVILLLASVLFLLLVGSFFKEEKEGFWLQQKGWQIFFMIIMFVGIVLIFLNAVGWLDQVWGFLSEGSGGNAVGSIILIVIIILFMVYIVKDNKEGSEKKKD
ncbi:MAG TPA: hypothetical protein VJH97_01070 [Candidatus Nanoarchaeia archaeon]|nr:hypothetical protein [Candidatus Nanoarchaeia archaeon]